MALNKKNTSENVSVKVDDFVLQGVLKTLEKAPSGTSSTKNEFTIHAHQWRGTMTELNSNLIKAHNKNDVSNLPGSPSALRIVINRIANRLRTRGVSVKFGRTNDRTRTRFVKFTR